MGAKRRIRLPGRSRVPAAPASLARWLRQQRARKGWTQDEAARRMGVTSQTWSRWERGVCRVSLATHRVLRLLFAVEPPR